MNMSLFGNKIAEINIEFYGQKKRKVDSSAPLEVYVEMTPFMADPIFLSDFYFKFLMKSSENLLLAAKPILWEVLNKQLKMIKKETNMMFTWEQLIDVQPMMISMKKKPCSFIKGVFNDNGKVKYKVCEDSRGGLETYYVPIAAMGFLQHIINTLPESELVKFYQNLANIIRAHRDSLKPNQQRNYGLEDLPPYNTN